MYNVNQLSIVCNIVDENVTDTMYNFFTNVHGSSNNGSLINTTRFEGDLSEHLDFPTHLEYNGYIPVVHEPYYIDMGNEVHFNPAPVFVPEAPGLFALMILAGFISTRKMR